MSNCFCFQQEIGGWCSGVKWGSGFCKKTKKEGSVCLLKSTLKRLMIVSLGISLGVCSEGWVLVWGGAGGWKLWFLIALCLFLWMGVL